MYSNLPMFNKPCSAASTFFPKTPEQFQMRMCTKGRGLRCYGKHPKSSECAGAQEGAKFPSKTKKDNPSSCPC